MLQPYAGGDAEICDGDGDLGALMFAELDGGLAEEEVNVEDASAACDGVDAMEKLVAELLKLMAV